MLRDLVRSEDFAIGTERREIGGPAGAAADEQIFVAEISGQTRGVAIDKNLPFPTNQTQQFMIKLTPAAYVAGVVVDEEGRPFPEAELMGTMQGEDGFGYVAAARTDANTFS